MRVLIFNNYDLKSIETDWLSTSGDSPSQHLWGGPELRDLGHDVEFLEFAGVGWLKSLSRILRVFGDLDLQYRAMKSAKDFDVIYCAHMPTVAFLAILRTLRLFQTPVIAVNYQSPAKKGLLERIWARVFVGGLDRILSLSEEVENDLRKLGVSEARLVQVRWGVDIRHYKCKQRPSGDEPHFVSVGKSFRDFQSLISGFPYEQAKLTVLGAGKEFDVDVPPKAEGRLIIRSEWIDWRDYIGCLPDFDALVLPISLEETRGNNAIGLTAATEALASGIPVISTENSYLGINLEAEGVGCWVPACDPDAWCRILSEFASDRDASAEMRVRARKLADECFNIRSFASTLSDAINEVSRRS